MNRGDAYLVLAGELRAWQQLGYEKLAALVDQPASCSYARVGTENIAIEIQVRWADAKRKSLRINGSANGPSCFRLETLQESILVTLPHSSTSPKWECKTELLPGGPVQHFAPRRDGLPVRYADALQLWQHDEAFRSFFISLLAGSPFTGYRWETPSISMTTAGRDFEFVLLNAPGLGRVADQQAFADHFDSGSTDDRIATFPNLGNDAVLVVPCPCGPPGNYVHLATFIRNAADRQKHALWRAVGAAMQQRLSDSQTWLSTAGMGVSWLHVRLDSRPKYYGFAEYRDERG